jgi:hypothetical protein
MKNYILLIVLCASLPSCLKLHKTYECKRNCATITISGNFTNATFNNLEGVANNTLTFTFQERGRKKSCSLGATQTNVNGNYTFVATIDTSDLKLGGSSIRIKTTINGDYIYHSLQSSDLSNYNNGTYNYNVELRNMTNVNFMTNRVGIDSFLYAVTYSSYTIKELSTTKHTINFTDTNKNRVYNYRAIAYDKVYFSLTKHSGIFDTVVNNPPQYVINEINNITIIDSIICLPNVVNQVTINY